MTDTSLRYLQMLKLIERSPHKVTVQVIQKKLDAMGQTTTQRTVQRDLNRQGWQWKADAALFSLVPPDTQEALTLCMAQQHLQNLLPEATLNYLKPWFAAAQARFFSATGGRERRLRARSLPDSHRLD